MTWPRVAVGSVVGGGGLFVQTPSGRRTPIVPLPRVPCEHVLPPRSPIGRGLVLDSVSSHCHLKRSLLSKQPLRPAVWVLVPLPSGQPAVPTSGPKGICSTWSPSRAGPARHCPPAPDPCDCRGCFGLVSARRLPVWWSDQCGVLVMTAGRPSTVAPRQEAEEDEGVLSTGPGNSTATRGHTGRWQRESAHATGS